MESEKEKGSRSKVLEEVRYPAEVEHFLCLLFFFNKRRHVNIILFACCM